MPIEAGKKRMTLSGHCTVEEAEGLFEWLLAHQQYGVNVAAVTHPHAAILQALMASQTKVGGEPTDEFSAECVRQALLNNNQEVTK